MATVINTPEGIEMYRLCVIRSALRLERAGLKRRGGSMYARVRREFGLKGNREAVYTQFCEYVEKQKQVLGF